MNVEKSILDLLIANVTTLIDQQISTEFHKIPSAQSTI